MNFKASGSTDSKNYLRLKDKEFAKVIFAGDLYEFRIHWVGNRSMLCTEDDRCPQCKEGKKSSFKFRVNCIVKENDQYTPKIFEQGWTVYETLRNLHEGDYNLENNVMKITRSGSGPSDTSYSILPIPNGTISEETSKAISALQLIDLKHKEEGTGEAPPPKFDSDEEIPF